ncbi:hypothetical protein [Spirosoma endophyticum]|uniref:XRE family transcriptional regulator n=1 Tax=Spirosoma endophyticum TaxID=662367 RepID=A0A1I1SIL9_9BACT|nr:hypothetical protein [Spirosoma endophyticum]SFD46314.1 hypothetical protein SAMN05216167_105124 [Spirosoma endophyticum]
MTIEETIRAFMLDPERRGMLSVSYIQKAAGIPEGNLAKFLSGKRSKLPALQIMMLIEKLKLIGFGVVANGTGTPTPSVLMWGNTLPLFEELLVTELETEQAV